MAYAWIEHTEGPVATCCVVDGACIWPISDALIVRRIFSQVRCNVLDSAAIVTAVLIKSRCTSIVNLTFLHKSCNLCPSIKTILHE